MTLFNSHALSAAHSAQPHAPARMGAMRATSFVLLGMLARAAATDYAKIAPMLMPRGGDPDNIDFVYLRLCGAEFVPQRSLSQPPGWTHDSGGPPRPSPADAAALATAYGPRPPFAFASFAEFAAAAPAGHMLASLPEMLRAAQAGAVPLRRPLSPQDVISAARTALSSREHQRYTLFLDEALGALRDRLLEGSELLRAQAAVQNILHSAEQLAIAQAKSHSSSEKAAAKQPAAAPSAGAAPSLSSKAPGAGQPDGNSPAVKHGRRQKVAFDLQPSDQHTAPSSDGRARPDSGREQVGTRKPDTPSCYSAASAGQAKQAAQAPHSRSDSRSTEGQGTSQGGSVKAAEPGRAESGSSAAPKPTGSAASQPAAARANTGVTGSTSADAQPHGSNTAPGKATALPAISAHTGPKRTPEETRTLLMLFSDSLPPGACRSPTESANLEAASSRPVRLLYLAQALKPHSASVYIPDPTGNGYLRVAASVVYDFLRRACVYLHNKIEQEQRTRVPSS